MKYFLKNYLLVSAFLCPSFSSFLTAESSKFAPEPLPSEVVSAINDSALTRMPSTEEIKEDLIRSNVNFRADSMQPDRFAAKTNIELVNVRFKTRQPSLFNSNPYVECRITVRANNVDKSPWTEKVMFTIYVGYNCLPGGKMLLMKDSCSFFSFETGKETELYFYIPWEIFKKYNLKNTPNYCAMRIACGGIRQEIIIVDPMTGRRAASQSNVEKIHDDTKERAQIEGNIMLHAGQKPSYPGPTIVP